MRLSQNSELIGILNNAVIEARAAHKTKVRRSEYRLKRDETSREHYIGGVEYILNFVDNSELHGNQLARLILQERDIWSSNLENARNNCESGNITINSLVLSQAFYDGVQHMTSIICEYVVLTTSEEGVMCV